MYYSQETRDRNRQEKATFRKKKVNCFSGPPSSVSNAPHLFFSDLNKKKWPHLFYSDVEINISTFLCLK